MGHHFTPNAVPNRSHRHEQQHTIVIYGGKAPARGIDPRGPRFVASITAALLLVTVGLALSGFITAAAVLLAVLVALFAVGAFAGVRRHPLSILFAAVVKSSLAPPGHLEDPIPPTFAQGVGFTVTAIGLALHLAGVPLALPVAAAFAFIAAFLNGAFGYCLGCQIYLFLVRAGVLGRGRPVAG